MASSLQGEWGVERKKKTVNIQNPHQENYENAVKNLM